MYDQDDEQLLSNKEIALVLRELLRLGSPDSLPEVPWADLLGSAIPDIEDPARILATGGMSMLASLGLIKIEHGRMKPMSRQAYFALSSLYKYLLANTPVVKLPSDKLKEILEDQYLRDFTRALEKIRLDRNLDEIDHEPIHHRRIVNLLIKCRQIRRGKEQDVYLHKFHPKWGEYHLIGLSQKWPTETDAALIKMAMLFHLKLQPAHYRIDPDFNPGDIKGARISATSGAYTEYTFCVRRVAGFTEGRLNLKHLIQKHAGESSTEDVSRQQTGAQFDENSFRWFTFDEIIQGKGPHGERIMASSKWIMESLNKPQAIPLSTPKADDVREVISIMDEIANRITTRRLVIIITALLIAVFSYFVLPEIPTWLGAPNPIIDNVSKLATIASGLVAAYAYLKSRI